MFHLVDFGTNLDGTVNTDYCRFCYQKGRFVDHGITLEERIEGTIHEAPARNEKPGRKSRQRKGRKPVH
jgi:hypothetical protein